MAYFPSIGSIIQLQQYIKERVYFVSKDEDGNVTYDDTRELPTIDYLGTVKLHGTNASISYDVNTEKLSYFSKEKELTLEFDNMNFMSEMIKHEERLKTFFKHKVSELGDLSFDKIVIVGEWIGKKVNGNKKLAIGNLPNLNMVVFKVKITKGTSTTWLQNITDYKIPEINILNIYDYQKYHLTINFNDLTPTIERLQTLIAEIETQCPFGKAFDLDGVGEGIVFEPIDSLYFNNSKYWFKAKGEKHAKGNKPKVEKVRDTETEALLLSVAEQALPLWRLEQGVRETFSNGFIIRDRFSEYFKWIINDVKKECKSLFTENNVEERDVFKYISKIAKNYIIDEEKQQVK
jgi:hypothetical protein